ncbi:transposase domain-containing protein (plasmid) [Cupriavidus basilensis]|uniref:Transposase domain-containing protein n=1 Tax=Cupriavidus basilensis TaxID=68895 RepID=A0A7M2H9B7_9BURK|nr:transposase domain-containing protein [Cupriavidus basilensis]
MLGTCRLNGIEPYGWLKDTLERLPAHPTARSTNCCRWRANRYTARHGHP